MAVEGAVGYMSVEVSVGYVSVGWACGRARGRGVLGERPSGEGVEWEEWEGSGMGGEEFGAKRDGHRAPRGGWPVWLQIPIYILNLASEEKKKLEHRRKPHYC
jgi:hypothetical protein